MHTVTLHLPKNVEAQELRRDLEEIIFRHYGKRIETIPFELPQGIGQVRMYEFPALGSIVTLTNDLNVFCQETPYVPGGRLYYTAKIIFSGFNEESCFYEALKQNIEYFNNKYAE